MIMIPKPGKTPNDPVNHNSQTNLTAEHHFKSSGIAATRSPQTVGHLQTKATRIQSSTQ